MNGLVNLLRITETGAVDHAAQAWIAAGLSLWAQGELDGAELLCCLGLPCTASKMSQAIRDFWLAHAASLYGEDLAIGTRAKLLENAARRFEGGAWHTWRRIGVDQNAGPVDLALFSARKAAPFPGSKRQLINILQDAGL